MNLRLLWDFNQALTIIILIMNLNSEAQLVSFPSIIGLSSINSLLHCITTLKKSIVVFLLKKRKESIILSLLSKFITQQKNCSFFSIKRIYFDEAEIYFKLAYKCIKTFTEIIINFFSMSHFTHLLLAIALLTHFVSPHLTQAPPTVAPTSQSTSNQGGAFQSENLDESTKQALRASFLSRNDDLNSFIFEGKAEKIENNVNQIKQLFFSFKNIQKNKRVRVSPLQLSGSDLNNALQEEIIIKNQLQNAIYLKNQIKVEQVNKAISMRQLIQKPTIESYVQAQKQYLYYEQKYHISRYNELPICVVIPTYNNANGLRHIRNIKSIVTQNYSNYHIVVFDDASTDGTGSDIRQFLLDESDLPAEKYRIIVNDRQMKAMYNLRRAAMQFCKPEELFMIVDGDDELIGRNVFKLYSALFQAQDAWFVYTNFLHGESNVGFSRPYPEHIVQKNNYRFYPLVASHLRVFYTKLFQNLKQFDLQDERGEYYKAANDVAICVPILEQAYKRVRYIAQITYYYNINTGQNNHILRKNQQRSNDRRIRRKNKYMPLETLLA